MLYTLADGSISSRYLVGDKFASCVSGHGGKVFTLVDDLDSREPWFVDDCSWYDLTPIAEDQLKDDWISVDGIKNVPIGEWLVYIPTEERKSKMQVAVVRENVRLIGNHFHFDMREVTHYTSLPNESKS